MYWSTFSHFSPFCGCLLFPTFQFFKVTRDTAKTETRKKKKSVRIELSQEHSMSMLSPHEKAKVQKYRRVGYLGYWILVLCWNPLHAYNSLVYDE